MSTVPVCLWSGLWKQTAALEIFLEGAGVEGIQISTFSRHLDFKIIISELPICILLIISINKDKSLSPTLRCNYNIPLICTKSTNRILFNT